MHQVTYILNDSVNLSGLKNLWLHTALDNLVKFLYFTYFLYIVFVWDAVDIFNIFNILLCPLCNNCSSGAGVTNAKKLLPKSF